MALLPAAVEYGYRGRISQVALMSQLAVSRDSAACRLEILTKENHCIGTVFGMTYGFELLCQCGKFVNANNICKLMGHFGFEINRSEVPSWSKLRWVCRFRVYKLYCN